MFAEKFRLSVGWLPAGTPWLLIRKTVISLGDGRMVSVSVMRARWRSVRKFPRTDSRSAGIVIGSPCSRMYFDQNSSATCRYGSSFGVLVILRSGKLDLRLILARAKPGSLIRCEP